MIRAVEIFMGSASVSSAECPRPPKKKTPTRRRRYENQSCEAIVRGHARAVRKFARGQFLAPFDLHGLHAQPRCLAAHYVDFFTIRNDSTDCCLLLGRAGRFRTAPE